MPNGDGNVPRTLAEHAVRAIEEAILRGDLEPGQRLVLDDLARDLDMSPMPVREALRRLETLGFVQSQAHRGSRVREVSAEDLLDLYRARLPLEVMAIRLAAQRFSDEDVERAERELAKYTMWYERGDPIAAREAHLEFHFTLYAASGSSWLQHAIRPLCQYGERYRMARIRARGSVKSREQEHRRLLDACRDHDPVRAGEELTKHLLLTIELSLPEMVEGDDADPKAMTDEFIESVFSTTLRPSDATVAVATP